MAKKSEFSESHLFLDAFRKKNALLQQDVADFLGTSRGYISMVEKGDSKLSASKIEMLYEGAEKNNWDLSGFIPAYDRLTKALFYILDKEAEAFPNQIYDNDIDKALSDLLTPKTCQKLKYGEIGVSGPIADTIVKHYPEINRQWLIDGTGEMLLSSTKEPSELEKLREEVRLLRVSLDEYKEENKKLLEALPGLIAAEIAKDVSNK